MLKLLSANFKRMWKNKFFHIGMAFMLIMGIAMPIIRYIDMKKAMGVSYLEDGFFAFVVFVAVIASILCSLFIGTEYSDGTMRNKLMIGHTRATVYFSNLFVCFIAETLMCFVFIAANFCVGVPLLGFFNGDIKMIIVMLLCSMFLIAALTSIFALVSMLVNIKAITSIVCILTVFFLVFTGVQLSDMLNQPERYTAVTLPEGSDKSVMEEVENPGYLRGTERKVYEFLYDFTPGGQIIQLSDMSAVHLWQMALYSTVIIVITTGLGMFFFRNKNLK